MGQLTLKTKAVVKNILKKSTSPCFKWLSVGDIIEFSTPLEYAGTGGNGTYAVYIECRNQTTGEISCLSFNQLPRVLGCCELEEINS